MLTVSLRQRSRRVTTEEQREPLSNQVKRLEGEVGPHAHHPLLKLSVFEQLKHRNVWQCCISWCAG